MTFEVNGQEYFLSYLQDEGRWALFRPGVDGIEQIPVTEDSAQSVSEGVIIPFDTEQTIH